MFRQRMENKEGWFLFFCFLLFEAFYLKIHLIILSNFESFSAN